MIKKEGNKMAGSIKYKILEKICDIFREGEGVGNSNRIFVIQDYNISYEIRGTSRYQNHEVLLFSKPGEMISLCATPSDILLIHPLMKIYEQIEPLERVKVTEVGEKHIKLKQNKDQLVEIKSLEYFNSSPQWLESSLKEERKKQNMLNQEILKAIKKTYDEGQKRTFIFKTFYVTLEINDIKDGKILADMVKPVGIKNYNVNFAPFLQQIKQWVDPIYDIKVYEKKKDKEILITSLDYFKSQYTIFVKTKQEYIDLMTYLKKEGYEWNGSGDPLNDKNALYWNNNPYIYISETQFGGEEKRILYGSGREDFTLEQYFKIKGVSMSKKTIGQKISELLSFGHIVEYESDERYETIIWGKVKDNFIISDIDGDAETVNSDDFDSDNKPVIRIKSRELKKLEEDDEFFYMLNEQIEKIEEQEVGDVYETTNFTGVHISSLAPLWYKDEIKEKQETIEIGGRKYDKKEFEEAVKDLEEIE
jgi:hypothetical protein